MQLNRGRTLVPLHTIYQYNTQSAFPDLKNKQIIRPLLLVCNLACEESGAFLMTLCTAGGAGVGEMRPRLPQPCAPSEFCSKVHQIYFIPS